MDNNNFNQPIIKPEPRQRLKTQQSAAWVMVTIVLAVLLVIAGGCWWFFSYRSSSPTYNQIVTEVDQSVSADAGGNAAVGAQAAGTTAQNGQAGQIAQAGQIGATNAAGTNADAAADAPATAGALLLNEPLKYTGTVTPGGVATLNITFYSNRRITGTVDYASGKKLDLIGSYDLADDGRSFTISMTAASPSDPAYSESWAGKSSAIKDDMAHTLSFNEIYTSKGEAMTASFALSRR